MNLEPDLKELEVRYHQYTFPEDRALTSYVAIAILILSLFFVSSDYILFQLGPVFLILAIIKAVYFGLTASFLLALRRLPKPENYDGLVFAWKMLTSVYIFASNLSRPTTYLGHYVLDVLLIVVFHLMPNRLSFRVLAGLFYSVLILSGLALYKTQVDRLQFNAILMACLSANILGLIASTRLYRFRREQFKFMIEEQLVKEELAQLAMMDPLTGVFNRRKFMEAGEQEFNRFVRYTHLFSVQIIDIDFFKNINDQFGHPVGDEALKHFTQLLMKHKRETDIFGRLGGEEFGMILSNTPATSAMILGERLRQKVETTPVMSGETPILMTMSVGLTEVSAEDQNFSDIMVRADRLLYRAKHNGRNRVEM